MAAELVQLAPLVHYLPGAVNQLVLEDGRGGALIVDTGLDEARGKQLLRALGQRDLRPTAILNTHSHADHHGGNAHILARFPELSVFAPPLEAAVLRFPVLEPLYLFGALPPQELQGKFLMAQPSKARSLPGAGTTELAGVTLELIEAGGHAAQMVAVRARDVLFAADALFGPEALAKHPLTFCLDSARQKASARALGELAGVRVVLPGHGEPTHNLPGLAAANLAAYERTTAAVKAGVQSPATIDEVLRRVCDGLGVQMRNAAAVVLNRSVVSAHLKELLERGEVTQAVEGNVWVWRTAG